MVFLRQQYPPDDLVGVDYYQPTAHGNEREIADRVSKLRPNSSWLTPARFHRPTR